MVRLVEVDDSQVQDQNSGVKLVEVDPGYKPTINDRVQSVAQGASFGMADEASAFVRSLVDWGQTGAPISDTYGMYLSDMAKDRERYGQSNPIESFMLELTGGGLTGVVGAAKATAPKFLANAPNWMKTMLGGGVFGGLYGFGASDPGERLQGAMTGSVTGAALTPPLAWAGGRVIGGLSYLGQKLFNKLRETPQKQARDILRKAIEDEGLTPAEASAIYRELGEEGRLIDVGENTRAVGRAVADQPGAGKAQMKNVLDERQAGQQGRIVESLYERTGLRNTDADAFLSKVHAERKAQADPLYKAAYEGGINRTPELDAVLERPVIKQAMKRGETIARNEGMPPDSEFGLLNRINYAKMKLDSQIAKDIRRAGKVTPEIRAKIQAKNDMLAIVDELNPEYAQARQLWSDASTLEDAVRMGQSLFKMRPKEIEFVTRSMTDGELQSFKMGAVDAVQDMLGNVDNNFDSVRRLVGKDALRKRMRFLFDSDESFNRFSDDLIREVRFMRTRQVVSGGSPTSQNLAGDRALDLTAEGQAFLSTDTTGKMLMALRKLIGKQKVTPELLEEITGHLMNKGMSDAQVMQLLTSGRVGEIISRQLGTSSQDVIRGIIAPMTAVAHN